MKPAPKKPNDRFFKFLDSKHVEHFLSGKLKLGGLDTYSLLEIVTGDKWIGDATESNALTRWNYSDGRNHISGNEIYMFEYGYCLSISAGQLYHLNSAMLNSSLPYSYDACIEILDIDQLFYRIGKKLSHEYSNFRLMGFEANYVTYSQSSRLHDCSALKLKTLSYDPFSKPLRYAEQSEYRIVVTMDRDDQKFNNLLLEVGDLSDIARLVESTTEHKPPISLFPMTEQDAVECIRLQLDRVKSIKDIRSDTYIPYIVEMIKAYGNLRFSSETQHRVPQLEMYIIMFARERYNPMSLNTPSMVQQHLVNLFEQEYGESS